LNNRILRLTTKEAEQLVSWIEGNIWFNRDEVVEIDLDSIFEEKEPSFRQLESSKVSTNIEWVGYVEPTQAVVGDFWDHPYFGRFELTDDGWQRA
jgi:hypothetical protein